MDEFTGAQPPTVVEQFVAGLVPKASDALLAAGDEASLREAIELDPARADVRVQLARILLADGREDEALAILEPVEHDREADGLLARSELARAPKRRRSRGSASRHSRAASTRRACAPCSRRSARRAARRATASAA